MGLLRAILTLFISIASVNIIFKNKERFEKIPILNLILKHFDGKQCYIIIAIMTIVMVIF